MILFIKHVDIEGPETLGKFLEDKGFLLKIVDFGKKQKLPKNFRDIEAVVSLGGPMNVYEEDLYPFLKEENEFLKQVLNKEIPFLGICLGSQLLAKACGAKVRKSPEKEIGFGKVRLTTTGLQDSLFHNLKEEVQVYQWHEDMFEIPQNVSILAQRANGQLLATSAGCPHQALNVGPSAYGLQFHVEITDKSIREWSQAYFKRDDHGRDEKIKQMLEEYHDKEEEFQAVANQLFENFSKIIVSRRVVV